MTLKVELTPRLGRMGSRIGRSRGGLPVFGAASGGTVRSMIPSSKRRSRRPPHGSRGTEDVRNVLSPLTGDAPVSADKHSALVQYLPRLASARAPC